MTPAKSPNFVHAPSPTPLPPNPRLPRPTSPLVIARGPGLDITLIYRGGPAPYQRNPLQVLAISDILGKVVAGGRWVGWGGGI